MANPSGGVGARLVAPYASMDPVHDSDTHRALEPPEDRFLPRVALEALVLSVGSEGIELARRPPRCAALEESIGFSPELVAVACDCGELNQHHVYGPEAARSRRIREVLLVVRRADEDALSRHGPRALLVRRSSNARDR